MNESLIETQLNYVQAATDEKHDISLVQQPNDLSYESFQYGPVKWTKVTMIIHTCKLTFTLVHL